MAHSSFVFWNFLKLKYFVNNWMIWVGWTCGYGGCPTVLKFPLIKNVPLFISALMLMSFHHSAHNHPSKSSSHVWSPIPHNAFTTQFIVMVSASWALLNLHTKVICSFFFMSRNCSSNFLTSLLYTIESITSLFKTPLLRLVFAKGDEGWRRDGFGVRD